MTDLPGADRTDNPVSEDHLIDRREVTRRTGLPTSTLYRLMDAGQFPRPLRVAARSVRWRASEISKWLDGLPRAGGDGGDDVVSRT